MHWPLLALDPNISQREFFLLTCVEAQLTDMDKSLIMIVNTDEENRDKVLTLCGNQIKRTDEYKY